MSRANADQADELHEETPKVEEDAKQLSLLGGVARADESDAEPDSGGSKWLGQGTLLMALVVAVAAGGIYFMRLSQGDMNAAPIPEEVSAKIEWALASNKSADPNNPLKPENMAALLNDTESFVAMFSADPTNLQVPLEYVQKNPFKLQVAEDKPGDSGADKREQDRRRRLESEAARLNLQSVIGGQTPMAMISGEILRVGATLGSFRVLAIDARSVELEGEGLRFTLHMAQ